MYLQIPDFRVFHAVVRSAPCPLAPQANTGGYKYTAVQFEPSILVLYASHTLWQRCPHGQTPEFAVEYGLGI